MARLTRRSATPGRISAPRARYALRLRVVAATALAGLAPLLVVFVWSQLERNVPGRMWRATLDAANEGAAAASAHAGDEAATRAALDRVARTKRVRLRVIEGDLATFDTDADDPTDALHPIEAFLFGAPSGSSLRELDDAMGPLSLRPEVAAARASGLYVACGSPGLLFCQAIRRVPEGEARFVVAQKTSARAIDAVYTLRSQLVRLGFVLVPLVLVLAFATGSRIARPITRLRAQALAKAGDASPDADLPEHGDELGDLAAAFNALLAALAARKAANEAFVADLVHEMKSPVAAVRVTADALQAGAPDADRAGRLARVLSDSAARLDRLVTQFLELARAEAGMPDEDRGPVDVTALARATTARAAEDERFTGTSFAFTGDAPAPVVGVAHRLDALVRELLENAASFAGSPGRVACEVAVTGDEVVLSVVDSGPGITGEDLPRVFDRFFTTRGKRRGTGLGLALVRAVAEAHGGRASVSSPPGGGARFVVRLPRA
jgi:two-component system sensor histidine kinase ChvG